LTCRKATAKFADYPEKEMGMRPYPRCSHRLKKRPIDPENQMPSNEAPVLMLKPDLTDEQVARFKSRLQEQVRALSTQDGELRARLAAQESVTANTFVAGIEGAMAAEADDEVIALLHHEQTELVATMQALERMDKGEYGYCTECGDPIGVARLDVLPEAHLCVGCQDMLEHRLGR